MTSEGGRIISTGFKGAVGLGSIYRRDERYGGYYDIYFNTFRSEFHRYENKKRKKSKGAK
ncbi:MAG: hypothetical protein PHC34_12075 [Candidatus Gastranaerophilales bacterium]|nr:hypothetical protein [Candidatus Gastranaerophilales bacterium]